MTLDNHYTPISAPIPADICKFLGLKHNDSIRFELRNGEVLLKKGGKIDCDEPTEQELHMLMYSTLAEEWLSPEDEEAFKDW